MSDSLVQPANAARRRVSKLGLAKVFWRSLFLQAAWNPQGMQNLGFAYALEPALGELHPDAAARAQAALRHLEFFNCHPYLAAAILGGAVQLEERVASGEAPPESVTQFKRALGPPFAALGDGFFWLALRPAAALAAAISEPLLGMGCLAVFLLLYNGVHLSSRLWLFVRGYQLAEGLVEEVARAQVPFATTLLKASGAVLAGAIAARAVLLAGLHHRPWHALLVGSTIVAAAALLPRLRLWIALYIALGLGLALGSGLF